MKWHIEFDKPAVKEFKKLDKSIGNRVLEFLTNRVSKLENPRSIGEALKGSKLGEFWKYRVGEYRIICEIQDKKLLIVVLRIGDRKHVYK